MKSFPFPSLIVLIPRLWHRGEHDEGGKTD
jgi:hypothetical protein